MKKRAIFSNVYAWHSCSGCSCSCSGGQHVVVSMGSTPRLQSGY